MLIVFDIDGTLANCDHRLHHIKEKPKNWKAFFEEAKNDTPIPAMVELFRTLYSGWATDGVTRHTILAVTGRPESIRYDTGKWLADNHCDVNKLYMRKNKDYRPDYVVKEEILDQIIAEYGQKPDMVFEDRKQVIDMWRRRGVFVVDVNQTGEDF
jgi:phosphoglycolate phosphatase-like HAD superfamily hydrolase